MKNALILVNGQTSTKRWFLKYYTMFDIFVCADGGANTASHWNIKPHYIIGDFDSITKETREHFKDVPQLRYADQNSTDLEKCLKFVIKKGFENITVVGATGGRVDHQIGNISALVKFSNKALITFVDSFGELMYIGKRMIALLPKETILSLLPVTVCEGITTTGLRWNLRNEKLANGFRDGISNVVVGRKVTIEVKSGHLLAYILTNK